MRSPCCLLALLGFDAGWALQVGTALPQRSIAMRPFAGRVAVMTAATAEEPTAPQPAIVVPPEGVLTLGPEGDAALAHLLEKTTEPSMQDTWRRAAFWENETASLLEIVNVLGRFESCTEWRDRTIFVPQEEINVRKEDERQSLTEGRHEMAMRMKCGERAALYQNLPNMPFKNAALASAIGLTVEDFQSLPVTRAPCEILYDAFAESRSTLIPYKVIDDRCKAMVNPDGTFNEVAFRVGWSKSCFLFIVGLFFFGKANFIWVLVGAKFLHDWQPDTIPTPKDMGLFKIFGVI